MHMGAILKFALELAWFLLLVDRQLMLSKAAEVAPAEFVTDPAARKRAEGASAGNDRGETERSRCGIAEVSISCRGSQSRQASQPPSLLTSVPFALFRGTFAKNIFVRQPKLPLQVQPAC